MKAFTIKCIGKKSGLEISPQSDSIIFQYIIMFEGKKYNINIKIAGIEFATVTENEIIKFGYAKIKEMIGTEKLKSTTYIKVDNELQERIIKI